MRLIILLLVTSGPLFAVQNQYAGTGVGASRDGSITTIPAALGSAGAALFTGLSGKTRICLGSTAATRVGVSVGTTTTNCSGGAADITIPGSGTVCIDNITINANVCIFSLSGSGLSSGIVDATVW